MAQRLVLSVDDDNLTVTSLRQFMKRIDELGISGPTKLKYTEDEGSHMITAPIPNGVVPRRRVVKRKKKEQQIVEAAAEQIKARKEAVAKGEQVPGSVPPVKGVKRAKKRKRAAKKTAPQKETKE